MDYKKLNDREALSAAIEMEERGYSFFIDSAAKAGDPLARDVFQFLANEELNHVKAIREFNDNFLAGKAQNAESYIKRISDSKSGSIANLFKSLTENAPISGGELDVYNFAIDFERKGEAFYKKAEADAADPNAKKLYGFLVGEERRHFKIVESCLLYFENPAEFFHQQERWAVDGI